MNRFLRHSVVMTLCAWGIASVQAAPAQVAPVAATVAAAGCDATPLQPLHKRLLDKASQGVMPLVQFVHRTRMIYQLDIHEVAKSLDGWRERAACAAAR